MSGPPPSGSGSLADRITKPNDGSAAASTSTTSTSWADEVASPTEPSKGGPLIGGLDGAAEPRGGSKLEDKRNDIQVTLNRSLAELQRDPNDPLFSLQTFEQLIKNPDIIQGLRTMNFLKPSKIQERALPLLLLDPPSNMIAQSQSGTGKTAAFVITILSRIDYSKPHQPQALCLAPSRELARQIEGVVQTIGQFVPNLHIQGAVPGAVARNAKVQASVIVGTPGTVLDLIKRRQIDASEIKVFCMDEADNLLDMQGLGDQSLMVKRVLPQNVQILLFSATFPTNVTSYAQQFCPNANSILLAKDDLTVAGIKQMFIDCNGESGKYEYLVKLYGLLTIGSSIIFVKQRATADRIAEALARDGHKISSVHGAFDGAERDRIVKEFRDGATKVLITTNVLARGLDVSTVSMVINYDIPMMGRSDDEPDFETYLHRIGRTGRFGRVGVSISFVFDKRSYNALTRIVNHFNIDLVQLKADDWDWNEMIVKQVIKESSVAQ